MTRAEAVALLDRATLALAPLRSPLARMLGVRCVDMALRLGGEPGPRVAPHHVRDTLDTVEEFLARVAARRAEAAAAAKVRLHRRNGAARAGFDALYGGSPPAGPAAPAVHPAAAVDGAMALYRPGLAPRRSGGGDRRP